MSTTAQATFTAPDISCGHCVARIQNAVGAVAGVDQVVAHEDTNLADAGYPSAD